MRILAVLFLAILTSLANAGITLHLVGDSTVKNSTKGQKGWGSCLPDSFDKEKISVLNHAIGGRSSRSFFREGRWDNVLEAIKPGDFVLIQFGHNDNGPVDSGKARAAIKGNGDEVKEIIIKETGEKESVRSFGGYLRHYAATAQAKGAKVILCSLVPRNIWTDSEGKVNRDTKAHAVWTKEAATQAKAAFLPLNVLVADFYDQLGKEKVRPLFCEVDHTHTSEEGAAHTAKIVAEGLRNLPEAADLAACLKAKTGQ